MSQSLEFSIANCTIFIYKGLFFIFSYTVHTHSLQKVRAATCVPGCEHITLLTSLCLKHTWLVS